MAESWAVRTVGSDSGAWDGGAALAWDCPFAIVNESTADVIEVRDLYVEMAHGLEAASGYLGWMQLRRITAMVGGVDETPAKHLGSAGDLPSQVRVVKNPEAVTTNGILHSFVPVGMMHGWAAATFNFPRFGMLGQHGGASVPMGTLFKRGDSATQPVVLREGEGVAVYCPGPGVLVDMRGGAQVRVQSTGACYSCPIGFSPRGPGRASSAIFNGSGSGVVIEVLFMQVTEELESWLAIPKCRVVVGPMRVIEGEAITARPYSSGNQALDVGVKCWKNGFLRLDQFRTEDWWLPQAQYEATAVLGQFKPVYSHQRLCARPLEFRTPTAAFPFSGVRVLDRVGRQSSKSGVVLRQGEGVAVAWGSDEAVRSAAPTVANTFPNGFQNMDFVAEFTRVNAPAPPGGGNTYSRSRVVNA